MKRKRLFSLFCTAVMLLVGGYAAAGGPPGLVAYWTFDEGTGNIAADSSGNGLDGTLKGNPQWVAGQLGDALDFNGSSAYVEVPDNPLLDITKEITIAAWTNMRTTASGEMAIVSKGGWAANDLPYELTETPGDVIFWQFYNDQGRDSCSPDSPPVNEWHHIAATYDGKVFKCYIDGELAEEWAYAGTMPKNTAALTIGMRSRGGTFFNGMIDDVAIYDRALSLDEILSIMEGHLKENPLANSPTPRNGAMIDERSTTLKWRPGDFAALHEVYFGEDPNKVAAATPADTDVFLGRQAGTSLDVGSSGYPYPDGLVPGQIYSWRVDEINDADPNSPWKGAVWQFQVRPLIAWKPWPPAGMKNVDPNEDLTWEKGIDAFFHVIYFGDDFDTVNNATSPVSMTVPAQYDPGPLELNKTYYWRVDESLGATAYKGSVWSFTTRGAGGGVRAQYFNGIELAGDPVLTQTEASINHNWGGGEVVAGLADTVSARWTADLTVPFTEAYDLITTSDDGVRLWLDGWPVIDNWTNHGATDNTARANLIAGQVYSIRMEWYENDGDAVAQLSWESPSLPRQIIPQGWLQLPLWATGPSPANTEPYAVQDAVLQWLAGEEATDHDVYFGDDAAGVANADTSTTGVYRGRQKADKTTFDPGQLEWGKSYFWRIDEINTANAESPWKGSVWSFTVADFLIVDNFESYTDEEGVGARIYETWADGYSDGSSGSIVGYIDPPFAEQRIVHGGRQSMPLDYNNVNSPFYSEAKREWSTTQNWTINGVDCLTLYFRGNSGNGQEKLYVILEDSLGATATVVHPDPAAVAVTQWTEWKIPLSSFTGVNPAKVKSLIIGLGDRNAPQKGGAGLLFIDDLRVTKP
jgi:hypothetical protein